jgi:hypothetical protein
MHVGVLAQVDGRQMEAEDLHGAQQAAQAAAGQRGAAVQLERIGQHLEVGAQGVRRGIGRGLADFVARRLEVIEAGRWRPGGRRCRTGRGGRARRRAAARGRSSVRPGQQFRRDLDQQLGQRQLAAQFMDFGQVAVERGGRLQAQGFAQDLGGDEGVAVAVAADPAADAEEGRQRPGLVREALLQLLRRPGCTGAAVR